MKLVRRNIKVNLEMNERMFWVEKARKLEIPGIQWLETNLLKDRVILALENLEKQTRRKK